MKIKTYKLEIRVRVLDSTDVRTDDEILNFIRNYFHGHQYTSMSTTFKVTDASIQEVK